MRKFRNGLKTRLALGMFGRYKEPCLVELIDEVRAEGSAVIAASHDEHFVREAATTQLRLTAAGVGS